MTISVQEYFKTRKADRKKETRYINVINKDSCTSCQSCATVCPVDCIYEVPSAIPGQSYHQIDTARCIGCQMCYRSPNDSSDLYQLTICPWNAIDMLHNPNVKPADDSILEPYWLGSDKELPWTKLEEYGYQLRLDGEVYVPKNEEEMISFFRWFQKAEWMYSEDDTVAIVGEEVEHDNYIHFKATEDGWALLDCIFEDYRRIFMD